VSSIPAEYNPLVANLDQRAQTTGDDKLHIRFETRPTLHPAKSTAAGRPIYEDVDIIIIHAPGSQLTSIHAPAKQYMDRFGDKYRAWKNGQVEAQSGTPLENFPFFFGRPSMVAELKGLHIQTVEQLATLPDAQKQKIMGGHELCKRAQDWLAKTDIDAAEAAKAATDKRIADLEALVESLKPKAPVAAKTKE
jgi:hypothetical protein